MVSEAANTSFCSHNPQYYVFELVVEVDLLLNPGNARGKLNIRTEKPPGLFPHFALSEKGSGRVSRHVPLSLNKPTSTVSTRTTSKSCHGLPYNDHFFYITGIGRMSNVSREHTFPPG